LAGVRLAIDPARAGAAEEFSNCSEECAGHPKDGSPIGRRSETRKSSRADELGIAWKWCGKLHIIVADETV
jgi:hypothetical protein